MSKQSNQPAPNDVSAGNKKKAFKEGEMDNTVKLDNSPDQEETGTENSIADPKKKVKQNKSPENG